MADIDLPRMESLSPGPYIPTTCKKTEENKVDCSPIIEDADLIEILWKQDIDLGIPRDLFLSPSQQVDDNSNGIDISTSIEKKEKVSPNQTNEKIECENSNGSKISNETADPDEDPWAGLAYTIDDETGEYILQNPNEAVSAPACESEGLPSDVRVEEDPYLLEKALNFIDFNSEDFDEDKLTESNFTLGALSPDPDVKLVRGEDLLLGSIVAPPQPRVRVTTESTSESQLEDSPLHNSDSLTGLEFDLGFYLSEEESSQVTKNSTESLTSNDIENIENQSEELEASLEDMIQAAQMHPRSLQVRMPLMRTMSMEHRWQDLANLLSLPDGTNLTHHSHPHGHHPLSHPLQSHSHPFAHPYPHAHHTPIHNPHTYGVHPASTAVSHHYGGLTPPGSSVPTYPSADAGRSVLLQNASVPSTLTELGANGSYPSPNLGSAVSLGSAVTASMNLTNSTEPLEAAGQSAYKVESTPDMQLYYQGNATEVNQTGDGFFPSIFNDDDLQLMDMAMTDTMYPTRMLDNQSVTHGIPVPTAANPSSAAPVPNAVLDTASDSAVSSMGSERVPSISDSDWIDPNPSDSNVTSTGSASATASSSGYSMDYSGSKYRGYEYGYGGRQATGVGVGAGASADGASARGVSAPVAQKKHHMFGKRAFHDQNDLPGASAVQPSIPNHKYDYGSSGAAGSLYTLPPTQLDNSTGLHSMELKYGCSMDYNHHTHDTRGVDHIHHNHSYALGSEASITSQRPLSRDKHRASSSGLRGSISDTSIGASTSGSGSESEAYSRDEKRARAMNIPMSIDDIINLPMDEFNERLSKYDLTEAQLSLIRDIRRRGKNKVAAQNCRKRKLDQILSLADEVKRVRERKIRLTKEREYLLSEKVRLKDRFALLYRHVFQSLRDPDGQPYSPYEYSLQQSADGNILLVPRGAPQGSAPIDPQPSRPLMEPSGMTNVGGIHHGTRRKAADEKNEP